ncbi:hypothetical protein DICVIV_05427 [Dictyocaulus viviparus]|uniref:DUF7622 domain-containing protein n=1 Tax=Dictyocaulus viviparus TaxID=29172 RepID=A0A0D8XXA8_DICVI|nr:hypothetical protein DICVIV_05427 [Dictyocaulus viviparus]
MEMANKGCISGVDKRFTAKIGCRTNFLGASMCVCDDGDLCNHVERAENTMRPLPIVRLPLVECISKTTGTGLSDAYKERLCSSNYCHMTKTEDEFPANILTLYDCGDMSEFDFDLRLRNTIDFPALYANGCYRIQYQPKQTVTDCFCSKNHCNANLPIVQTGPIRCYMSYGYKNESVVDKKHFCDGDYCFVQKQDGKYTKGCLSVNERNSWSHIKSGYRQILDVDQWICQQHLCNFDLTRVIRSISALHQSIDRLGRTSESQQSSIILIYSFFVTIIFSSI